MRVQGHKKPPHFASMMIEIFGGKRGERPWWNKGGEGKGEERIEGLGLKIMAAHTRISNIERYHSQKIQVSELYFGFYSSLVHIYLYVCKLRFLFTVFNVSIPSCTDVYCLIVILVWNMLYIVSPHCSAVGFCPVLYCAVQKCRV